MYKLVKENLSLPKSPHTVGLSSIVVKVCCSIVVYGHLKFLYIHIKSVVCYEHITGNANVHIIFSFLFYINFIVLCVLE